MGDFSHLSSSGTACMVDITGKQASARLAIVSGRVQMTAACREQLQAAGIAAIIGTARIAGIQASKQTATLLPLCHQLPLSKVHVDVQLDVEACSFLVTATTATESATGVEMEAFTAAALASLTIYDMIKAVDPAATVGPFQLQEKRGGKTGHWTRPHG